MPAVRTVMTSSTLAGAPGPVGRHEPMVRRMPVSLSTAGRTWSACQSWQGLAVPARLARNESGSGCTKRPPSLLLLSVWSRFVREQVCEQLYSGKVHGTPPVQAVSRAQTHSSADSRPEWCPQPPPPPRTPAHCRQRCRLHHVSSNQESHMQLHRTATKRRNARVACQQRHARPLT